MSPSSTHSPVEAHHTAPRARNRRRWALVVALLALLAGGCRGEVEVLLDVEADGSGQVGVTVVLDSEAVSLLGGGPEVLEVDDLGARGWTVDVEPGEVGGLTVTATKGFADVAGATAVLGELAGGDGPLSGFAVERRRRPWTDEVRVSGTLDLSRRLEGFADDGLRDRLGADLEDVLDGVVQAGGEGSESLAVEVVVRLPGDLDVHDGEGVLLAGDSARWTAALGEVTPVVAVGTVVRTATLAWWAVGAAAATALAGLAARRAWRRRRPKPPRG